MPDWSAVTAVVEQHLGKTFPAAQVVLQWRGVTVYARNFGLLDPETRPVPIHDNTRFDLASVSKLFTVTALMRFVQAGRIGLDQPVREFLPEFDGRRPIRPYPDPLNPGAVIAVVPSVAPAGSSAATPETVDAGQVTIRNLIVHNSGLPAWLALWKIDSRAARRRAALESIFSYPTGARVVYSDIGLILVGLALERITSRSLDEIIFEQVTGPLDLPSVTFGPLPCENVAPTEFYTWRRERQCGLVHDENSYSLGGVAGHAGLFGTAHDVAALGAMYLRGGAPLLEQSTVVEMTRLQAADGAVRRGLGFALRSPDPEAPSYVLGDGTFGHTGFTGTSLWVDPTRALVVVALTNRVYYGRANADALNAFRLALHSAVVQVVDRESLHRD